MLHYALLIFVGFSSSFFLEASQFAYYWSWVTVNDHFLFLVCWSHKTSNLIETFFHNELAIKRKNITTRRRPRRKRHFGVSPEASTLDTHVVKTWDPHTRLSLSTLNGIDKALLRSIMAHKLVRHSENTARKTYKRK